MSVEVKRVIGALCRLLAATGLEAVPSPETFRRAKFCGGVEVEDQFLQLLANILQTANNVSCDAHDQLSEASEHRSLVAAGLWQTGYHAAWVYGREEGGGSFSRDLLLALGWLLATGTLERLLSQRAQQLDKTLVRPTLVNPHLSCELQLDSALLRKLQWLIGCLRYQGRILLSLQEEQTHLLHAVSAAVLSSTVSPSYKSSAVLMEDCARVQQLCDLLEAYLNWKQGEKVFWTWMDSVVDCHLTDPVVGAPTHAPKGSARVCHHGNRGLEKLEDMQLRLPTEQLGQRSGSGDAEDRREGGERLQELFDIPSLPPPLSSLPSLPSFPQVFQARLQTEKPVKGGGAGGPDALPSTQAARLLLQAEALLLEMQDRHRLANRMQLQEMIGRLDELVLIPP